MIKKSSAATLLTIHGLGYLAPLLTVPFLINTLGLESFGKLSLFTAFFQYLTLTVEYGFGTSAAISISRLKNSNARSGAIFWNITTYKALLSLILLSVTIIATVSINTLMDDWKLILSSFTCVWIGILMPSWLFIGKEKIIYISKISITAKFIAIPFILAFISGPDDAWLVAFIQNSTSIIAGALSIAFAYKHGWIPSQKVTFIKILVLLKKGWHISLASMVANLYTHTVTIILGITGGTTAVGMFMAADRVRQALQGFLIPTSQIFLARINSSIRSDIITAKETIRIAFFTQATLGAILSSILYIFSNLISHTLYKESPDVISEIMRPLSILPLIISISNVCLLVLTSYGMEKIVSKTIMISGVFCITTSYLTTKSIGAHGVVLSIILAEILILTLSAFKCHKENLFKFSKRANSSITL